MSPYWIIIAGVILAGSVLVFAQRFRNRNAVQDADPIQQDYMRLLIQAAGGDRQPVIDFTSGQSWSYKEFYLRTVHAMAVIKRDNPSIYKSVRRFCRNEIEVRRRAVL